MLLVKTKIGPSNIAGIGLFAAESIKKDTPVWKFQEGFDLKLSESQFKELSEPAQEQVLNYCYFDPILHLYIICSDDARFFNHSDNPNVNSGTNHDHVDCASRDIEIGEELTQNYKIFDGNFGEKLE